MLRLATAYNAVALLAHSIGEVLVGQRMSRMEACSTLARHAVGRQLLQQLEHELLTEAELAGAMLPRRPELEGEGAQVVFPQRVQEQHGRGRRRWRV